MRPSGAPTENIPLKQTRQYLDPVLLSKLGNMELVARCAVEGFFSGMHPSPFHGFSVEYSDHRDYQRGDELRYLDWKMYGRSDKLYIKQFRQDTNVTVYVLLDSSKSMSFAGAGSVSKLDYGSFLAASLTYLMLRQNDAVGLFTFADRILRQVGARSRRTHLNTILKALQGNKPAGRTRLPDVLHAVAEATNRRGLVILISDLLDDACGLAGGLAHLKYLKHDVLIFHTLDRQELLLDYEGLVQFKDIETGVTERAFPRSIQAEYRRRVRGFLDDLRHSTGRAGIDYCLLNTSEPLDKALMAYLARRKRSG